MSEVRYKPVYRVQIKLNINIMILWGQQLSNIINKQGIVKHSFEFQSQCFLELVLICRPAK